MSNPSAPERRSARSIFWRVVLAVALLILAVVGGGVWYASTPRFENIVRHKVIAELEQVTGGRVELGAFHWRLLHLEFSADNLTIHGLEAPGQIPYAHVDRIYVRAKIISFFRRQIGLNYLEADHPVVHLIVSPDGSTNQPHPKVHASGSKPVIDTIFDLAVNRAEVRDGVAIVNQQAMPFNAAANDVAVTITYVPALGLKGREKYLGAVRAEDVTTQRGREAPIHSTIDAQVELGHNRLDLQSLQLQSGNSRLDISGALTNFADPAWKLQVKGGVELQEIEALSDVPGLNRGQVQLDLQGSGNKSNFIVNGQSKVTAASYHAGSVHVAEVNAETGIHITQGELDLTGIRARLAQGGYIDGDLKITQWLHATPPAAVPALPPATTRAMRRAKAAVANPDVQRGTIRAHIHNISLASIMAVVAPPHYRELGFDTEASGEASVDWAGSADAFVAGATVTLVPPLKPAAHRVPMYGTVDAQYSNVSGLVNIHNLDVHTPASAVKVTGSLGAYPITRASQLQVTVTTTSLAEFDRAMSTLGVASGGKQGVNALPVALHGQAAFAGTITDSILTPDVKGHLNATNFDLIFSAPAMGNAAAAETAGGSGQERAVLEHTVHWDSIDANAEYSSKRVAVTQAVLMHGPAEIHLSGELDAQPVPHRRSEFDEHSAIRADVSMQNASAQDLLKMAGAELPVTGTLNLKAHVNGTIDNLSGGGHLAVQGGAAYGEAYKSLNADLRFAGREVDAANLLFLEDGGKVTGDGGYNLKTDAFHFDALGAGFDLAHIQRLQNGKYPLAGDLGFEAHGSGTIQSPSLQANLHLTRFNFDNAALGFVDADAHTQGRTLLMNVNANLSGAQLQVHGQTQMSGDYDTQAHLTLSNFDVDPILKTFNVQGITADSSITASVNVSGPLREPRRINGDGTVQQFAVSLAGVALKSDGALHATLMDGRLHLDPLHITGEDTNLRVQGSAGVLTEVHDLNVHASGSVNMTLAQTLDSDLSAAGHVDFSVDAGGSFTRPALTGDVKFTNVSVSLQDFPNGLSQVNGTLEFDQDRLDVKSLTAVSGGGKLTLGGFVTYQQGLYADLSATARNVRIRYPQGLSSMADAKLRLQGTQQSSLLSGNITITRFVIGSGLDLTTFGSSTGSVTLPPNPNAPSNHVRMDIHVVSAPQLDFQNSYAKLAGDVDLRVRGTVAQPMVLGHISITEGSATFAGTKYELQHGDIYFSNPIRIDPVIDLTATARVEDYDITIGLTGTASKPSPTFRSEPPLSEQDIFSLLALGRTQEEQQINSNMQAQAGVNSSADALLGGALNATLSSRVQKLFGGGSVKIDPTFVTGSGNSTARITVQQQVSKNATLTYATNVNSTAQQLIQAEVNLTQNVSVLAVRDESGVFSLVFKLRRGYR
ncbi:MAG: translocation/assembly module TamB [Silvibacterium sp.]